MATSSLAIDAVENGYGDTILSRDKAKRLASWMSLEKRWSRASLSLNDQRQSQGRLDCAGQRHSRFLTRLTGRYTPDQGFDPYENKTSNSKSSSWTDRKRNNVVLSRRAVVEASMGEERAKLMENLREALWSVAWSKHHRVRRLCGFGRH